MTSNSVCSTCLRAMRQQARLHFLQTRRAQPQTARLLTTSRRLRAQELPKPAHQPPPPAAESPFSQTTPPGPQDNNVPPPGFKDFAASLRRTSRSTTEPYVAYGGTEDLFRQCSRQCSYTIPSALAEKMADRVPPMNATGDHLGEGSGWWLESKSKGGLGLEATFNSWAQVLYLHMWMLTVRLRCFPKDYVRSWEQNLLDHFFYAAEDRMATWHGMSARGVRNKNLKDLWLQWRGCQLSYDEALAKESDTVMASAIWRNVFKANENVDAADLATVTAYTMRELQRLGNMTDAEISEGKVTFGEPKGITQLLSKQSPAFKQRLTADELKAPELSGQP